MKKLYIKYRPITDILTKWLNYNHMGPLQYTLMFRATVFWPCYLICSCILDDFLSPTEQEAELYFEQVPFNHPLFIMYSSGTTGAPKCMVHSVGVSISRLLERYWFKKSPELEARCFLEWSRLANLLWGLSW